MEPVPINRFQKKNGLPALKKIFKLKLMDKTLTLMKKFGISFYFRASSLFALIFSLYLYHCTYEIIMTYLFKKS
jgi:hypothetical protein